MITTNEFQEYIDSFHKEKGSYTEEELMKIGVKFKQLPHAQRSWKTLHAVLGIKYFSPEAYRLRVKRYLNSNPRLLNPSEEGEVYKEDYVEQQKIRDWYNAYRRDIRQEIRIENLRDEIQHAADKFPKLDVKKWMSKPPVHLNSKKGEVIAVALFSDLHIGVECDNYYNSYSTEIAAKRLALLALNINDYCKLNHVDRLDILNLGDSIQGLIHTNYRIEQQLDVAEQIITAGELISNFLASIAGAAPRVTYHSVFDNHSRAIADKNEHIEKEQFSRVIDWFIEERLKDSDIEFMDNKIDGGIGQLDINGKKLIFVHGHQDGRNSSMQSFVGLTREWVDYVCMAHYHNPAAKDYQGCKVFINGSIVGTESYAFGKRLFNKPSQKLLIFNPDNNNVQDINISLE